MKAISEKSMLVLAALALGLIIAWLILSDQNPTMSPALVSVDGRITTAAESATR